MMIYEQIFGEFCTVVGEPMGIFYPAEAVAEGSLVIYRESLN